MEDIVTRIKEFRKKKGYTYDAMAEELKLSPAAYRKIETNQTKLTVEKLYQIAQILDAKVSDLLDFNADKAYKQEINENGVGYQAIEHFYADNKETADKFIKALQEEVAFLRKLLEEK